LKKNITHYKKTLIRVGFENFPEFNPRILNKKKSLPLCKLSFSSHAKENAHHRFFD